MANAGEITKLGLKIADMAGQGLTFVANSTFQSESHIYIVSVQMVAIMTSGHIVTHLIFR